MKTVEKNVQSEFNKEFEQIRANDKQEIQLNPKEKELLKPTFINS
jgi:hypothetical protein